MTQQRWIDIGSVLAALGGLSWIAKVAVILATDGKVDDEGAAALFYLLGAALMLIGSTAIGTLVAAGRSPLVRVAAVALSPIIFVVSYAILDGLATPLVGDRGAAYWSDEVGILTTGLAWLLLGIGLFRTARQSIGAGLIVPVQGTSDSATVMKP